MNLLWDVVRLRDHGRRSSRQEVLSCAPVRGLLQLSARRPGWHVASSDAPLLAGLVLSGDSTWVIPPLDSARVKVIRSEHVLISGIEAFDLGRQRVERHRQAWWCRIVIPASERAVHVEVMDEDEALWP